MQRLQAKQRTVGWNLNFLSNKEQNYRFLLENLKKTPFFGQNKEGRFFINYCMIQPTRKI
jgi:hypothetical protein